MKHCLKDAVKRKVAYSKQCRFIPGQFLEPAHLLNLGQRLLNLQASFVIIDHIISPYLASFPKRKRKRTRTLLLLSQSAASGDHTKLSPEGKLTAVCSGNTSLDVFSHVRGIFADIIVRLEAI